MSKYGLLLVVLGIVDRSCVTVCTDNGRKL